MKIKSLFVAVLLMAGVVVAPTSFASERPTVESFTFTPQEIELGGASTKVSFELVVSHPNGISTQSTFVNLKSARKDSISIPLKRSDSPINLSLTKVTFKGSFDIPRNVNPGVYQITVDPVKNNSSAGYEYDTGTFSLPKVNTLIDAETALLIRNGGYLDYNYATFVGPTFETSLDVTYNDVVKYTPSNVPIWKVGETVDPSEFYEQRISSLPLLISSSTTSTCVVSGKVLKLIARGTCAFNVFTERTKDFAAKVSVQTVTVETGRIKPTLVMPIVENQKVKAYPETIELSRVIGPTGNYLLPQSTTPTICYATGFFVKLTASGTCTLTYQSQETDTYLASEIFTQTFKISKEGELEIVPTPVATPTPTATPTATPKPVVKKTISCVKGTKTIKKTAISPKCPAGYKLKK
jgi:hypothetical protein